jgi:DNA-binding transcriptional ArsR family regulator
VLAFAALADPVRREIVEMLARGEATAGAIADRFPVSRPAVSRHLRVLREAGLVASRTAGQHRVYALERAPLAEIDGWLDAFRPLRAAGGPAARLDALDTEMHRGRRERRRATTARTTDEGDSDDRTA